MSKFFVHRSPGKVMVVALLCTIVCGTLLLGLPWCTVHSISWIDLFFTSCSATTVTGWLTVPLDHFTFWGHLIILVLMQVGGLGLITMLLFFMSVMVDMGLASQFMASEIFEMNTIRDIKRILKFTIALTALCEIVGAIVIFFATSEEFAQGDALFKALFQSVSSFCNVGMTLFPGSMTEFAMNTPVLLTMAALSFIGGVGFLVLHQLVQRYVLKQKIRINLHTKIVVIVSVLTVVVGSLLYWILEYDGVLAHLSFPYQVVNAVFNATCMRSAGFISVQFSDLQFATVLVMMIMAFVGSSPGSTGGGIKTTSCAIVAATIRSIMAGREFVYIKKRKIRATQVYRAAALFATALLWVLTATFLLLITEVGHTFLDVLFEAVSAFANLGLSSGLTASLSTFGKVFVMATEIAGRIGSLTFMLAFRKMTDETEFVYPEERVMLG
jgi:trk system potassium uptake protein